MSAPTRGNQALGLLVFEEIRVVFAPTLYDVWVRVGRQVAGETTWTWRYTQCPRTEPLTTIWARCGTEAETWAIVPDAETRA